MLVAEPFFDLGRLDAYRYDLIGSLIGIAGFTLLSFLGPPPSWGIVAVALTIVLLLPRPSVWVYGAAVVLLGFLAAESFLSGAMVAVLQDRDPVAGESDNPVTTVIANGVPHQAVLGRAEEGRGRAVLRPALPAQSAGEPRRHAHHRSRHRHRRGSGAEQGATSIDAVEIDPKIRGIG